MLSVTPRGKKLEVLIKVEDAESLWQHLKSKGVQVDPLSETVLDIRAYSLDRGKPTVEVVAVRTFEVSASLTRFEDEVGAWLMASAKPK